MNALKCVGFIFSPSTFVCIVLYEVMPSSRRSCPSQHSLHSEGSLPCDEVGRLQTF